MRTARQYSLRSLAEYLGSLWYAGREHEDRTATQAITRAVARLNDGQFVQVRLSSADGTDQTVACLYRDPVTSKVLYRLEDKDY
jgi:hypothetical protein